MYIPISILINQQLNYSNLSFASESYFKFILSLFSSRISLTAARLL